MSPKTNFENTFFERVVTSDTFTNATLRKHPDIALDAEARRMSIVFDQPFASGLTGSARAMKHSQ